MNLAMPAPNELWAEERTFTNTGLAIENLVSGIRNYIVEMPASLNWRSVLRSKIDKVYEDCSRIGWDGYDASPLSEIARNNAQIFIDALPETVVSPEISPENDGNISFDWTSDKSTMLSISIEDYRLVYAGIIGNQKFHGEVDRATGIPDEISEKLIRYFKRQTSI